jgi:demethylmenaquinone methyltransferase / 2-methoxy-6-polyprenyl-1,4-benzoquinol methylase
MKEKGNINRLALIPSRDGVNTMFDQISPRYELINGLLSFGIDHFWRKTLSSCVRANPGSYLDVATGTGQVLAQICHDHPSIHTAIGLDPSLAMLQKAKTRAPQHSWVPGFAENIPFESDHFDLITMSFGIRNTQNPLLALQEMHRALKSDGQLLILEFSLPKNQIIQNLYRFYLGSILPTLGGLLSGEKKAYQYLSSTIQSFPYGEAFEECLQQAGFMNIRAQRLTLGVVSIYQAFKTRS